MPERIKLNIACSSCRRKHTWYTQTLTSWGFEACSMAEMIVTCNSTTSGDPHLLVCKANAANLRHEEVLGRHRS